VDQAAGPASTAQTGGGYGGQVDVNPPERGEVENVATRRAKKKKRYFTISEANATLPLVRAIIEDIIALFPRLRDRYQRLMRVLPEGGTDAAHLEELYYVKEELLRDQERMQDYERELRELGVELKDYEVGLVDFPCRMDDREVYLCWKMGESEVAHWHELDAGFQGRQSLLTEAGQER
jgi:hypothetical protein